MCVCRLLVNGDGAPLGIHAHHTLAAGTHLATSRLARWVGLETQFGKGATSHSRCASAVLPATLAREANCTLPIQHIPVRDVILVSLPPPTLGHHCRCHRCHRHHSKEQQQQQHQQQLLLVAATPVSGMLRRRRATNGLHGNRGVIGSTILPVPANADSAMTPLPPSRVSPHSQGQWRA